MPRELSPFERWMVESNLRTIRAGGDADQVVATLRANGYPRIADAVEKALRA